MRGNATPCACFPGRVGGVRLQEADEAVPAGLRELGLTEAVWREHMNKLTKINRSWKEVICAQLRCLPGSYVPAFWLLPHPCAGMCHCCSCCGMGCCACSICIMPIVWHWVWFTTCGCVPWTKTDPSQHAVRRWLNDLNLELRPRGAFAKMFTFKQTQSEGNFHNDVAMSALVIALSPEEIQVLTMESVLQDGHSNDPNWGCWCCICHQDRVV